MDSLPGRGLRVLYALSRYPHLAHTYMMTEIETMRRYGVDVEVYSSALPLAPFATDVPLHNDTLGKAIEDFKPHLVHVHWTHRVAKFRGDVEKAGLPLTVRGHHPHDYSPKIANALQEDPVVRSVYMFKHFADLLSEKYTKVIPVDACFDPVLYYPDPQKDTKLVVRTSPARKVKDLDFFIRVAARCPQHRFVLVPCTTAENLYPDELRELNRSLGSPVEIRVDISHQEISSLMRKAGIYLYTVSPKEEYAMPISVSEAIGAGCYVLNRDSHNARVHNGNAGGFYSTEDEAVAVVNDSLTWSSKRWNDEMAKTLLRAEELASPRVVRPILDDWLKIAGVTAGTR